jgi:hypothetical protein
MKSMWVYLIMATLLVIAYTPEVSVGIRTLRGDDPFQIERTRQGLWEQARKYGRSPASDAAGPPDLRGVGPPGQPGGAASSLLPNAAMPSRAYGELHRDTPNARPADDADHGGYEVKRRAVRESVAFHTPTAAFHALSYPPTLPRSCQTPKFGRLAFWHKA